MTTMNHDPTIRIRLAKPLAAGLATLALAGCRASSKHRVNSVPSQPISPSIVKTITTPNTLTSSAMGGLWLPPGKTEQVQYLSDGSRQITILPPADLAMWPDVSESCDATKPAPNAHSTDIESDWPGDTLAIADDDEKAYYYIFKAKVCENALHRLSASEFAAHPGAIQ
jgi:hypothetical protein